MVGSQEWKCFNFVPLNDSPYLAYLSLQLIIKIKLFFFSLYLTGIQYDAKYVSHKRISMLKKEKKSINSSIIYSNLPVITLIKQQCVKYKKIFIKMGSSNQFIHLTYFEKWAGKSVMLISHKDQSTPMRGCQKAAVSHNAVQANEIMQIKA